MKPRKKLKAFVYPYAICLTLIPFMERSLEHHKVIFFSASIALIVLAISKWTSFNKGLNQWHNAVDLREAISHFVFIYAFALTFNPYVNSGISHSKSMLFACVLGLPAFLMYLAKTRLKQNK